MSKIIWDAENGWHDGMEVSVGMTSRGKLRICEETGTTNHSDDMITAYTGRHRIEDDGTAYILPVHLCGYHASKRGLLA